MDITRLTLNILVAAICCGINFKTMYDQKKEGKSWSGEMFGFTTEIFVLCCFVAQAYYISNMPATSYLISQQNQIVNF